MMGDIKFLICFLLDLQQNHFRCLETNKIGGKKSSIIFSVLFSFLFYFLSCLPCST